jgi:hypothetical protein
VPRSAAPGPGRVKSPQRQGIERVFEAESGMLPIALGSTAGTPAYVHDLHPDLTAPRPSCWLGRCCPSEPSLHPQGRPCRRPPTAAALAPADYGNPGSPSHLQRAARTRLSLQPIRFLWNFSWRVQRSNRTPGLDPE